MAPDSGVLEFIKDWLWFPLLGLLGWAFTRNDKEHEMLHTRLNALQDGTSAGHSVLNDRLMEHVDTSMTELREEQRRRSDKLADHIEKLFANAEKDRAAFSKTMADHREDSFKRHIELMTAINSKADK